MYDYIKERNYQEEINMAAAAGDMEMAAELEKQRNAKIDGEGLSQEKTYTYTNENGSHLQNEYPVEPTGGGGGSVGGGSFGGRSFGAGFSYDTAPLWTSKYSNQIDALTKSLLGRDAFAYNPQTDPLYQNYVDQYTRAGSQAMKDTLGQVSARTGGLASSYATGAAQGAYNNYMQQATDKMPDLYKLAYSMYQDEGNNQLNNINLLQGLEGADYSRYQDSRDFNYGVGRDAVSDARYTDETGYARGRDAIADERYGDETAYDREQDAIANSRKTSTGGGSGPKDPRGYTSVRDTMVSLGIKDDTTALDYLISTGMGVTAAQALSDGYSEYYQEAIANANSELPINMSSVLDLGYGPIDAERLNELVESGLVEEYVKNGKLNYRRAGSGGGSNSVKDMMGINGLGG